MKKLFILPLIVLLMGSCQQYLDIKPYGKTIPETPEEFAALLHDVINDIDYGEPVLVGDFGQIADFEFFADNLESNLDEKGLNPAYIGAQLSMSQNDYTDLYEYIRNCNIVLGYMTDKSGDLAQDVLGTAYAIRGVCYYQLLRMYCEPYESASQLGVPIVTEFDMEAKATRSSYGECIKQAESDLKKAISYGISDKVFRFNNDNIEGYLARLYFWTEDYASANEYALKVLSKHPLLDGEEYKDMINSQLSCVGNTIFKSQILTTSSSSTVIGSIKNMINYRPISKRFIDLFTEGESDIRYSLSIGAKRKNAKSVLASMRSAEMCLIAAESYYHNGKEAEALALLNDLRSHRIDSCTPYTMQTLPEVGADDKIVVDALGNDLTPLLSAILVERRKEFYMENGDRWFELKRNGRPEMWVIDGSWKFYTRKYMYTFPLPATDVLLVDGLIQNEGYEEVI